MLAEKRRFSPESEAVISCKISVYPPLEVRWTKKTIGQPDVDLVSQGRISIDSQRVSLTEVLSSLVISAVEESDTAVYTCSVAEERERVMLTVEFEPGERCEDSPTFQQCVLVVNHGLCSNKYYSQFCCRSELPHSPVCSGLIQACFSGLVEKEGKFQEDS